ncbi:hypothetical protein [Halobacterium zhouii]|uniref:hypothetical protein n=1 Tax=Halobacterium zhouii TaxID=2902624 RepID=UPI001E4944ED|nr:hypothetical protein [Halobacterium zhouii]
MASTDDGSMADLRADGGDASSADVEAAKTHAVAAVDGDPECVLCSSAADYFLFEAGHVEQFVCWEHVSPHSAAVEGDPEETPEGRPVALEL